MKSGLHPDKTIEQVAREGLAALLERLSVGTISKNAPHAEKTLTVKVYNLAVDVDVEFTVDEDDEVLGGCYAYYEAAGRATIEMSLPDAMALYEAVNQEP